MTESEKINALAKYHPSVKIGGIFAMSDRNIVFDILRNMPEAVYGNYCTVLENMFTGCASSQIHRASCAVLHEAILRAYGDWED
jgi:hypothetical protein